MPIVDGALEGRVLLSNFLVTSTGDSGPGTLRQAIIELNSTGDASANRITFGIQGTQALRIQPITPLPDVTKPVVIDGRSQGGAGYNGAPLIELDGSKETASAVDGLRLTGGSSTLNGFVVHGFSHAQVVLMGAGGDLIVGNYVGTNLKGNASGGGAGAGLVIFGTARNTIGGTAAGAGNIISGNAGDGVDVSETGATKNVFLGNAIGTDGSGTVAVPNRAGLVFFGGATANTVGGTAAGARNLISGNAGDGLQILQGGTTANVVIGNFIGTGVLGLGALSNGIGSASGNGISIFQGASGNTIGGAASGAGNVISGNRQDGIDIGGSGTTGNVILGNLIGVDVRGKAALPEIVGVLLYNGASGNTIGGTSAGTRNIISGNSMFGVCAYGAGTAGNVVAGNFIGTDISATAAIPNATGISFYQGASGNTIGGTAADARNIISGNVGNGVTLMGTGTSQNVVLGNFIGTGVRGLGAISNGSGGSYGDGVTIFGGASGNVVGGTTAGARNIISGNRRNGVSLSQSGTTANVVEGNSIGANLPGNGAVPNDVGIVVYAGASGNTIGGTTAGAGNLISGNGSSGVYFLDTGTSGNKVQGNFIGTDVSGTTALPSGTAKQGDGVDVFDGASNNTIGGTAPGAGNLISGNRGLGIVISGAATTGNRIQQNRIGTDVTGTKPVPNRSNGVYVQSGTENRIGGTAAGAANIIGFNGYAGVEIGAGTMISILSNSIFSNTGPGIQLDNAANSRTPAPVFAFRANPSGAGGTVHGTVTGKAGETYRIEIFQSLPANASAPSQARTFLGFVTVTANQNGVAAFSRSFTMIFTGGSRLTATATSSLGNTSTLSASVVIPR